MIKLIFIFALGFWLGMMTAAILHTAGDEQ